MIAAVREAIGPQIELLIDAHALFNVPTAVRLATRLAADSDQRDWVQQMASGSGASTERVRRGRAGALGSFARQLTDAGFYVERGTTTNGVTYRLTDGRPHPTPTVQDAA